MQPGVEDEMRFGSLVSAQCTTCRDPYWLERSSKEVVHLTAPDPSLGSSAVPELNQVSRSARSACLKLAATVSDVMVLMYGRRDTSKWRRRVKSVLC